MRPSPRNLAAALAVLGAVAAGVALLAPSPPPEDTPEGRPAGLSALLADLPAEGFRRPEEAGPPDLPGDHGAHPDARIESWTLATHLSDATGAPLAVQVALMRVGLVPPGQDAEGWQARAVWRGHVALLPGAGQAPIAEERFVRALGGASAPGSGGGAVQLDDWTLGFGGDGALDLSVTVGGREVSLRLTPQKPPVSAGAGQGGGPVRGYALTRLSVAGEVGGRAVSGLGWLDHAWGELPLPGGPVAWDRLLVQLDDGRDLSLTRARRQDGRGAPTLDGVLVHPDGRAESLDGDALSMAPVRRWQGPDGAGWPVAWRLEGPQTALDVAPVADDQALDFVLPVWSGLVTAGGRLAGTPATGRGTLQLTGYAP